MCLKPYVDPKTTFKKWPKTFQTSAKAVILHITGALRVGITTVELLVIAVSVTVLILCKSVSDVFIATTTWNYVRFAEG